MLMEQGDENIVNKIFDTKYNWSLLLLAALIYGVFYYTGYSNSNYDRTVSWFSFMILFSGASLIASYLKVSKRSSDKVGEYATTSFVTSMVTLLFCKSIFNGAFSILGVITIYGLGPISIFLFLLLLKQVLKHIR